LVAFVGFEGDSPGILDQLQPLQTRMPVLADDDVVVHGDADAVAAVCYAITGIILAGFIGYASPTAGSDYLLLSIAAVVVGGTPFTGGRGSVIASGAAALLWRS
jgi:hypothetical protein